MKAKQIIITSAIATWCSAAFLIAAAECDMLPLGQFLAVKAISLAALIAGGFAWAKAEKKGFILKVRTNENF